MQCQCFRTFASLIAAAAGVVSFAGEGHYEHERHPDVAHWMGDTRWHPGKGGAFGVEGDTLWYGGDFDGRAALSDERNNYRGTSAVFDNFIVTEGGWQVTEVFANLLFNYGSVGADFEIRSGVTPGNGGTLHYQDTGAPMTQTATGRSWQGWTEYTVSIDGLDLFLSPGEYWLVVRSVTFSCGGGHLLSRAGSTSGVNGIGQPIADGNSYFRRGGINYQPTSQFLGSGTWDFSFGVNGTVVPEPGTWFVLGAGLLLLSRRKR